jgi:hypothetical protein
MENDIRFSQTSFKGSFSTHLPKPLPQTKISVEKFSTRLNKGSIDGNFSLDNLETPDVDLKLKADIKLEDWQNFFPKNYLYKTAGQAIIDLSFANRFTKTSNFNAQDFAHADIKGKVVFENEIVFIVTPMYE